MRSNQNTLVKIDKEAMDIFKEFIRVSRALPSDPLGIDYEICQAAQFGVQSVVVARSFFSPAYLNINEDDQVKFYLSITVGCLIYAMFCLTDGENRKNDKWYNYNYKPSQPLYPFHYVLMDKVVNLSEEIKLQFDKYRYFERFSHTSVLSEDKNAIFAIGALVLAGDLPFDFKMCDSFVELKDRNGAIVSLNHMAPTMEALLTELRVKSELELPALPPAPGFFRRLLTNIAHACNQLCNGASSIFRKIGAYFSGTTVAAEAILPGSTSRAGNALGGLASTQVVNDVGVAANVSNERQSEQHNAVRLDVNAVRDQVDNVSFRR